MTPAPHHRTRPRTHHPPTLDLIALRDQHLHHYLRYASLVLPAALARQAVHEAFDNLARRWHDVLATPSPTACAWQSVRHRIRALAGPDPLAPVAHLTASEQDVLLLHLVLGLPPAEVAQLTGTDPAAVHVRLRSLTRRAG
ncbi:sigma factor-like helix-turn-helix DNA-binding protein [Kitasatospora sp. NPDC094019]|uniref:sigma factor-like helix-turn-helix DNA-binding protein n=1 Tax=Kitasatospora sp. NPDC094019 TaxID=3364091 RepID=UPI003827C2B0